MTPQDTLTALRARYAVKKFDSQGVLTEEQYALIEETLRLTPSSFGLEPWKFFIITDKSVRTELYPYSMKNTQVRDASALIVLCAKDALTKNDVDEYIAHAAQMRGVAVETLGGFKKVLHGFRIGKMVNALTFGAVRLFTGMTSVSKPWAENQVFIALGNVLSVCAIEGIDACPMGGFDERGYKKILRKYVDIKGYSPVVLCAVGKRASDDAFATMKKVRREKNDVVVRI